MSKGLIKARIKGSPCSSFRSIIGRGIVVREDRLPTRIPITGYNGGLGVGVTTRSISIYRVDISSGIKGPVSSFGRSEVT